MAEAKKNSKENVIGLVSERGVPALVIQNDDLAIHIEKTPGTFIKTKETLQILQKNGQPESLDLCRGFSHSAIGAIHIMSYNKLGVGGKSTSRVAVSTDGRSYKVRTDLNSDYSDLHLSSVHMSGRDMLGVARYKDTFHLATSRDALHWKFTPFKNFELLRDHLPQGAMLIGLTSTYGGIYVMYYHFEGEPGKYILKVGGFLISYTDPHKIAFASHVPIWTEIVKEKAMSLGAVETGDLFIAYWRSENGKVFISKIPKSVYSRTTQNGVALDKHPDNPLIVPNENNFWEAVATFNPAALYDGQDVHLLYRAMGNDGVSRIGYAKSTDGFRFICGYADPVYEINVSQASLGKQPRGYNPAYYTSGGGWGGCEDPRMVRIGGKVYMTYVSFEGWHNVRMSVSSIDYQDLKDGIWSWSPAVHMSPPGQVHKNWVLFPEKINGKFAIIHGLSPNVLVDYVDSLDGFDDDTYIKSQPPHGGLGYQDESRKYYWDDRVRGAGPPPLRTRLGWLLLYHATNKYESHKYKLGAMILDINDPTQVLYRSEIPLLSPEMYYENQGKPGIVYASGAIIREGRLVVYYGGGDRVVCAATIDLEEFLGKMSKQKSEKFQSLENILIN